MSQRPPKPRSKPAAPDKSVDDLQVLHPEREMEIAGVKVTMREYGFVEGMRLAATAAPVVHDLSIITGDAKDDGLLEYARLQAVFADHVDAITGMVAQACDQPREWVETLGDADGQTLLFAWWAVNGPFFVRRVLVALQMRMAAKRFNGATSTPSSPPPATATPSDSGDSRVVN